MRTISWIKPYRYFGALLLILYLTSGALRSFAQTRDSSRVQNKDSALTKVDSLQAITVSPTFIPTRMRGDTLEYNTSNIRLRPHADVEEVLTRLPGLHVMADGTIFYNGEKISQVLVDGEDVFVSNPTMITRILDGDKIAKVQILDRISDKARFTGVDDGVRIKVINLVLKESSKNGYFGKAEAGANTLNLYNGNAFLSSFVKSEQFTALGLVSNTGVLGFSDRAGGMAAAIRQQNSSNDQIGSSAGPGIPKSIAGALHYANSWDQAKEHFTVNYQYNRLLKDPFSTTKSEQLLPDTIYTQDQLSRSINRIDANAVDVVFDQAIDSLSAIHFYGIAESNHENNQFNSTASSVFNNDTANTSQRSIRSIAGFQNFVGSFALRRSGSRKPKNIFSFTIDLVKNNNSTDGYVYSINKYYQASRFLNVDTTDQRKDVIYKLTNWTGSINYTLPLWKGPALALSYKIASSTSIARQDTYARGNGKYQDLVDSLSSDNRAITLNQLFTINLQGATKLFRYTLGSDIVISNQQQKDYLSDSLITQHYAYLNPRLALNSIGNKKTAFVFNYFGSPSLPSLLQLQAVRNNNDPLHISIGNKYLKPGYNQTMMLEFHHIGTWVTSAGINLSTSNSSISTKILTDSFGRQLSQPVNTKGGQGMGINLSANKAVLGLDFGISSLNSYNISYNFVGVDLNRNDSYNSTMGISIAKNIPNKLSIQIDSRLSYLKSSSSINTTNSIQYWTQSHNFNLALFTVRKFEIGTNLEYTWQGKTNVFSKTTAVMLWNAAISRSLLDDKVDVRFRAVNLLNLNSGISRSSNGYINSENISNILGRYWMFSAIYHFSHQRKNH